MKPNSALILSIAALLALLDRGDARAADSTGYKPVDVPWQRPSSAASADSAAYATNAGTANSAATANALCPTCTIAGSQVSGQVGSAGYAANSNYANSAGYANNAGYAASGAASAGASCGDIGFGGGANGAVVRTGAWETSGPLGAYTVYICVSGVWVQSAQMYEVQ